MKMRRLILISVLVFAPVSASATIVACPGVNSKVIVERGHQTPPEIIEPDEGAEKGSLERQWNYLNEVNAQNEQITAHCYPEREGVPPKVGIDIDIPHAINRCVLDENGWFICVSLSLSCPGKVDHAFLTTAQGKVFDYNFFNEKNQHIEWTALDARPSLQPFTAHCFSNKDSKTSFILEIPKSTRDCLLLNGTFACDESGGGF